MVKIFFSFLYIYLCLTETSAASFSSLHHTTMYDPIKLTAELDAEKGFSVSVNKWILLLLSLAVWAMPETRPVCLLDARCAGFCVRGTDVRGRDQVLLCEIMCIHDVGSSTLPLLCGVGVCLSTGADLSAWHLVGPCFLWMWAVLCCTEEKSGKVLVMVSLSVPRSEMEVAQALRCSQSWVFPPYVHPLLPASPSHFQQPGWVTVSPRQRKDVSHSCEIFF